MFQDPKGHLRAPTGGANHAPPIGFRWPKVRIVLARWLIPTTVWGAFKETAGSQEVSRDMVRKSEERCEEGCESSDITPRNAPGAERMRD